MKPEGQAQRCIFRRSMVFNLLGDDRPVWMWTIIPLPVEWEFGVVKSKSSHAMFVGYGSVPYMTYIAHVATEVWCGDMGICDARVGTACV